MPFRDYPVAEYLARCVEDAEKVAEKKGDSIARGLHSLGEAHYTTFRDSAIGKVVFGILGSNVRLVIKNSPKGYRYSTSYGRARVTELTDAHAIVEFENLPFVTSLQAGVYEGGVRVTGFEPEVFTRVNAGGLDELKVLWR